MSVGLRIYGDSGAVQVDELYRNFCLVAKGTKTTTATTAGFQTFTVSLVGTAPFIAWTSDSQLIALTQVGRSGTTWTFTLAAYVPQATAYTFTYYVFDAVVAASSNRMGLVVKDASGNITFDSNYNYARIEGISTGINVNTTTIGAPDNSDGPSASFAYTSTKRYAVAPISGNYCANGFPVQTGPGNGQQAPPVSLFIYYRYACWAGNTGSIVHQGKVYSTAQVPGGANSNIVNASASALAIDVTNY